MDLPSPSHTIPKYMMLSTFLRRDDDHHLLWYDYDTVSESYLSMYGRSNQNNHTSFFSSFFFFFSCLLFLWSVVHEAVRVEAELRHANRLYPGMLVHAHIPPFIQTYLHHYPSSWLRQEHAVRSPPHWTSGLFQTTGCIPSAGKQKEAPGSKKIQDHLISTSLFFFPFLLLSSSLLGDRIETMYRQDHTLLPPLSTQSDPSEG